MVSSRVHGGPGPQGPARHDFSHNGNAAGPCPAALRALAQADASHYPDPAYTRLRESLAAHHGVDASRILVAASASEFILRLSAWAARQGLRSVSLPQPGYGDYAHAAQVWGLAVVPGAAGELRWYCDPSSPIGEDETRAIRSGEGVAAVDLAYAPLRLEGRGPDARVLDACWQLWTPNKALGLTGVRGAYAVAPREAGLVARELEAMAPSWPVGAHGVALLEAWTAADTGAWLEQSRMQLREWKAMQLQMLQSLGWRCLPSVANFFVTEPPGPVPWHALRERGVQLRDCASFGLPGCVRLSVQRPAAQEALRGAWLETRA